MREYRIQCEDDPWPEGQRPIGSAHPPAPVTFTRRDLQRACPLTCNGTAIDVQSSTVARSHPTELATERQIRPEVCVVSLRERHDRELEHRATAPDFGLDALTESGQVCDLGTQDLVAGCQGRVRLVEDPDRNECSGGEYAKGAVSAADHGYPVTDGEEPEKGDDHEETGPGADLCGHEHCSEGPKPTD